MRGRSRYAPALPEGDPAFSACLFSRFGFSPLLQSLPPLSRTNIPNPSLWLATATGVDYPALAPDDRIVVDVTVIGAGIAGLTTALLLKRSGARVALVEAGRVCAGVTAYTTGKVSSLHGLTYRSLLADFGEETARIYGVDGTVLHGPAVRPLEPKTLRADESS